MEEVEQNRRLVVEPVIHPTIKTSISVWENLESGEIDVDGPLAHMYYKKEEVIKLGGGDFQRGIMRIGQNVYLSGWENLIAGSIRPFQEELNP